MLNDHFAMEFMFLLFCPVPYVDFYISHVAKKERIIYYFFSELMLALMAFRIIFFVRSVFNYYIYTDAYSKKIC